MGIMSNKVSRRIALGTIAGGLGGAALILQALKGRYDTKISEGEWTEVELPPRTVIGKDDNYEIQWASDLKAVQVPIEKISGPATFTLECKPRVGTKFRLISLNAEYSGASYPAQFPQPPLLYFCTIGQVDVVPPIVDEKAALSITKAKRVMRSRYSRQEEPSGEGILVPQNGGVDYFQIVQGVPARIHETDVNTSCRVIGSSLVFDYPKGIALNSGKKWTISENKSECGVKLACEIAGFAEIAEHTTMKILAERHVTPKENADIFMKQMQTPVEAIKERGANARMMAMPTRVAIKMKYSKTATDIKKAQIRVKPFSGGANLHSSANRIIQEEITQIVRLIRYVDLKTGICVRQELTRSLQHPKQPREDKTTVIISQMLDS